MFYTHALNCSMQCFFARRRWVTEVSRRPMHDVSREPLKALRDLLHHVARHCFLPNQVRSKRYYQKLVLRFCQVYLPQWHVATHPHREMLLCHELYWRTLQRDDGTPCRLAEFIHLLVSNRQAKQSWSRWCVHVTACLIDPVYNLIPERDRYGLCLGDGTAFGPGHQRVLFDSLDKYMGGHEIANFIFERGAPRIFDWHHILDSTASTRKQMLIQTLSWWMCFLETRIAISHYEHPHRDPIAFGRFESFQTPPSVFRSAPYKRTTMMSDPYHNRWRQGQSGEWLWLEDGYTTGG